MVRGTTPTHVFETDTNLSEAVVLFITYRQNGRNIVEKSLPDENVKITDDSVTVKLTQAETLGFSDRGDVRIQIRAGFADGSRIASNIIITTAGEILKDGEI